MFIALHSVHRGVNCVGAVAVCTDGCADCELKYSATSTP